MINAISDKCDKSYSKKKALKLHYKIHQENLIEYKCDKCEYSSTSNLQRHMKTHLDAIKNKYKCDQCELAFHRSNLLLTHIRTHR